MEKIKHHIHRHVGTHHINTLEKCLLVFGIVVAGVFGIFYTSKAYPEVFGTSAILEKQEEVKLDEPVVINFSLPVLGSEYEESISVFPKEEIVLKWEKSRSKLFIYPKNHWQPQTKYRLTLPRGKNIMLISVKDAVFEFSTQNLPKVESVIPRDKADLVMIDIEDPIVVKLKKSSADFFLKFTLNEADDFLVENNPEKTEFRLMPKNNLEYSTTYIFKIYARYIKDKNDSFKEIYESSFTTAPPPNIVWNDDFSVRLEQAKKYTRARIQNGKYIDVNLSSQVMTIFEDGKMLDGFMVSSGKRGMDTPKGETQIYNKAKRVYSSAYGLYMPYWMSISPSGKYGLHELPEWPGGYKEGASHLGIPVSHGCVRLGVGAAGRVFDWAEIGTPVVIY